MFHCVDWDEFIVIDAAEGVELRVCNGCRDVTGPRGTGGGSNLTGGEYTEKITGRVMQGIKEFLSGGGGGGAGMFSLTEWIMKGAVWFVLLLFVCTDTGEQRSYGGRYAGFS